MSVRYQNVFVDETWSRNGDFYLSHRARQPVARPSADRVRPHRIRADHRFPAASEHQGAPRVGDRRIDDRRDVHEQPRGRGVDGREHRRRLLVRTRSRPAGRRFLTAFNTLGVVYQRHGNLPQAQVAFEYVLEREPGNTRSMSNVAAVLFASGQTVAAESADAQARADRAQSTVRLFQARPCRDGEGRLQARTADVLEGSRPRRVLPRVPVLAGTRLSRPGRYRKRQGAPFIAEENSTTRDDRDLYAAKLAHLNGHPQIVHDRLFFNRPR